MSERTALRAPARDGAVVVEPPLREVGALLAANRQRLRSHAEKSTILGRSWFDLRRQARQTALSESLANGRRGPAGGDIVLVAGHQPELFHPGVWVKNFALHGLALAHNATPLNLVVDSDTVKTTALRVPIPPPLTLPSPPEGGEGRVRGGPDDRAHVRTVLFDRWTGEVPYEERTIADRQLFASFGERVSALLRGWHYEPMLSSFWAEVLRQAENTPLLGECFAAARRTFERSWGCHNREAPLSALCRTEPFAWFACHLLAYLPQFHSLYNAIVGAYRQRHGIRDRNHPVPDLGVEDDWLETPFWGWRAAGSAKRGRLFARIHADQLELRAGADAWPSLPQPEERRAAAVVEAWRQLEKDGFKVRSRALTTTLYARLFLADLFVHGIGGGKYDELTDELIQRFYDCEPPRYLVLSATRWLPLPRAAVTVEDRRSLIRSLRDVHYNPQRHLHESANGDNLAELAAQKQAWIDRRPATAAERRERFQVLRALTDRLRRPLREREEQLRQELAICEWQLETNAVLQRRDYSFCLFPADSLRPFCTQFLKTADCC